MFIYTFKALNLSTKENLSLEIEAITIAEAMEKGKRAFFKKFGITPEESSITRK